MTEREASAVISYREGYTPPESVKQYMMDLSKVKILGVKNEVEATKQFKGMRTAWRKVFQ